MDLIWSAFRQGHALQPFMTVDVPANYGTEGSLSPQRYSPPTVQPGPDYNPYNPQYNRLFPVDWNEYVLSPAEASALEQAGLLQLPVMTPATFTAPGTASLAG